MWPYPRDMIPVRVRVHWQFRDTSYLNVTSAIENVTHSSDPDNAWHWSQVISSQATILIMIIVVINLSSY